MATPTIFRDFALNFAPNPATGDISVVTNEQAIRQSIQTLVMTSFGEWLQQSKKGSPVGDLLFDLATPITKMAIQKGVLAVINNYEPRAVVVAVDVVDKIDLNAYKITITFISKSTTTPVTFDFLLTRVR